MVINFPYSGSAITNSGDLLAMRLLDGKATGGAGLIAFAGITFRVICVASPGLNHLQ